MSSTSWSTLEEAAGCAPRGGSEQGIEAAGLMPREEPVSGVPPRLRHPRRRRIPSRLHTPCPTSAQVRDMSDQPSGVSTRHFPTHSPPAHPAGAFSARQRLEELASESEPQDTPQG